MRLVLALVFSATLLGAALPVPAAAQVACGNGYCPVGQVCTAGNLCAFPQGQGGGGGGGRLNTQLITQWANDITGFINYPLVPLLIAVAFIVFLWGVYKYFIYGGGSEDARSDGKTFVMYGIVGFVIIFSLWGLVNVGVELLNVGTGGRGQQNLPYPAL